MAVGALISGGLVWWHPIASQSALLLPGLLYLRPRRRPPHRGPRHPQGAGPPWSRRRRRDASGRGVGPRGPRRGPGGLVPAAPQPGARRARGGRAVLVGRHGGLRDVPADPAGRAARQRGRRGRGHGPGRERRMGPVRARLRAGRGRQPAPRCRADGDPGPGAQRARRGRHGPRRGTGRPHRRLRGDLHAARRRGSGPRRPAPPRGLRPQPVDRAVDELDDLVPRVQPHRGARRTAGGAHVDPGGDGRRRGVQHPRGVRVPAGAAGGARPTARGRAGSGRLADTPRALVARADTAFTDQRPPVCSDQPARPGPAPSAGGGYRGPRAAPRRRRGSRPRRRSAPAGYRTGR